MVLKDFDQLKRIVDRRQNKVNPSGVSQDILPVDATYVIGADGNVVPATVRPSPPRDLYSAKIVNGQIVFETKDPVFSQAASEIVQEDIKAKKESKRQDEEAKADKSEG